MYGLAGLRVGYGFAHETLIRNLLKVKLPFEPGVLAEAAAVAALQDEAFVSRSLEVNARGLRFVETALVERGFTIVPSQANFTMVVFAAPASATEFVERLLKAGVIVRPLASFGLPCCVRISIGTEEQNRILIDAIDRREAPGLLVSAPNGEKMAERSLHI